MISRRQLWIWLAAALAATAMLSGVLVWNHEETRSRWRSFWAGDPRQGARLFFEEKGCGKCHPVNGRGGSLAPDLGFARSPQPNLSQLVSAMWNCAPRTWERIQAEGMPYPNLNDEEMAHLFAFLYTARYVDEPGDTNHGRQLLGEKGCTRCHALLGSAGEGGPELSLCASTAVAWAQAMWNQGAAMEARVRQFGLSWPTLNGSDMNDLLAYMGEICPGPRWETDLLPASPERGWQLFQNKSCIDCHSVNGEGGRVGPELGPSRQVPLSIGGFAAAMWNHSPEMQLRMKDRQIQRPVFDGREIADLVVFLSSLRYVEPVGSPIVGKTLFEKRECSHCHGPAGRGNRFGPALRGRAKPHTTVTLAAALWQHGPDMYHRTQKVKVPWPALAESDIGNLISFLNSPAEVDR